MVIIVNIIQTLLEHGCKLHSSQGASNVIKCSDSFIQKFPDKPWTVLVKSKKLEEMRDKLVDTGDINISGVGMGGIREQGAWSKIEKFDVDRHIKTYAFDADLIESEIDDESFTDGIERLRRLSNIGFEENDIVNTEKIARKELGAISDIVEKQIEESYSEHFGDSVCTSKPDMKRIWTPQNADTLQFKIISDCMLPESFGDEIENVVTDIGNRETFKTVNNRGINSIFTPDKTMYLRKIIFHDKSMGGPFVAFSLRDRKYMKEPEFIENIKMLEDYLS